jgi:hypothetical protein
MRHAHVFTSIAIAAIVLSGCGSKSDNVVGIGGVPTGSVPIGSINNGGNSFRILAGSTVTNTGMTTVSGDIGVWPGTAVSGFGPGTMTGNSGLAHSGDPVAHAAESDLTIAYNNAAGRAMNATVAGNIGGQTLAPGVYKSTSSLAVSSGDLTLDAKGDANGVFIFQIASTLDVTSGRKVILSGGALAKNVFWQVGSSATLGTTSDFSGTIMANTAVSLLTGATLHGRALAEHGAVSMEANVIGP